MKDHTLLLFLVFPLLLLFACTDDNSSPKSDTGRLLVQLTDTPFPHDKVAEVNVIISKIDARLKNKANTSEADSIGTESNESGSPFIVLMEENIEVNLLELTNGLTTTLADIEVPSGSYDLVRVFVTGVNVVLTDSTIFDLKVPSGEQSGIKVFIKPHLLVEGGLTADLLLDFDVSRSFVPRGNVNAHAGIKGFIFKPVIKASNNSVAGTLTGLVNTPVEDSLLGLEGVQITVFAADTVNTSTFTDPSGMYTVMGLMAGSYDIMAELEGYESQTAENILVIEGNKTIQDFELVETP